MHTGLRGQKKACSSLQSQANKHRQRSPRHCSPPPPPQGHTPPPPTPHRHHVATPLGQARTRGGGEGVAALGEDLHHEVGQVAASQVQALDGVGQRVAAGRQGDGQFCSTRVQAGQRARSSVAGGSGRRPACCTSDGACCAAPAAHVCLLPCSLNAEQQPLLLPASTLAAPAPRLTPRRWAQCG